MVLFLSVMVSILFIEVIASIATFASISNKGQRDAGMRDQLKESIDKYSNDDHSMSAWDLLQTELDCCGLNTVDDWGKFEKKEKHLPRSCCGDLPVTIGDKKVVYVGINFGQGQCHYFSIVAKNQLCALCP